MSRAKAIGDIILLSDHASSTVRQLVLFEALKRVPDIDLLDLAELVREAAEKDDVKMMKVLVATEQGQGKRKNDFSYVPEGELVTFGFDCSEDDVDGICGCRRSLTGVVTHKATTTFAVKELPIKEVSYVDWLFAGYQAAGYTIWTREDAATIARKLLDVADMYPVGTVLERRGRGIGPREGAV